MIPIKVKNLLSIIAIENKEDLELLQKLNTFYWNRIRETLSTTDESVIQIINLGRFFRKHNCLINLKNKLINCLAKIRLNIYIRKQAEEDLILVNKALLFIEEENKRKANKKIIKDEYKKTLGK